MQEKEQPGGGSSWDCWSCQGGTECNSHSFNKHAVSVCLPEVLRSNAVGNRWTLAMVSCVPGTVQVASLLLTHWSTTVLWLFLLKWACLQHGSSWGQALSTIPNEAESPYNWVLNFPGGSAIKTPHFHCRGRGFHPWSGNQDPDATWSSQKTKQNQVLLLSL